MENNINILKRLDAKKHIHAANYLAKYKNFNTLSKVQQDAFKKLLPEYIKFLNGNIKIKGHGEQEIKLRTKLLNNYFDFISSNNYDNTFTSQGKFRSTIMEEFMYMLFNDLIIEIKEKIKDDSNLLKIGRTKAYTNLYFAAKNLKNFIDEPKIEVNKKDQDFAIYRPIALSIGDRGSIQANLPVLAVENKTYIDKTMLEGSIATAEKIKSGNPYSLFIIVTETYEVDLSVDPAYSRIDQIYVLRKSKNSSEKKPIYSDVLFDLVSNVKNHLTRNWSDIEQKMNKLGKII